MKILFFDGYCSLCNGFIDWSMKQDKQKLVQYASLQGESAQKYLSDLKYVNEVETIVYYRENQIYDRSSAILIFFKDIGGVWQIFSVLFIIPKFIRDFFYKIIAKNRYLFFKKRDTCRLPTPEEKERLLP